MTEYCRGAIKATITIFINNQIREKIISNSPAVNVTLQHGQTAQIQGSGLDLNNNCGQLPNSGIYEYDGFLAFAGVSVLIPFSNPAAFCSGLKPSLNGVTTSGIDDVYHPNAKIIRQYSSDWVLTVSDAIGQIITKKYSTEPTYTVACGDECPEGYCKIDCEAYPGYCCLNEAEIKSLSNQLR